MPLIHPFTHTFTHQRQLAAMQGTNQLVRSNWGLGVLLRDTSTRPEWDRTGNPPNADCSYLLCHIAPKSNQTTAGKWALSKCLTQGCNGNSLPGNKTWNLFACKPSYIICHLADSFIQSNLQLIRLSRRHTPWSNVGLRALLKGPTSVQVVTTPGIEPLTLWVQVK